ncbi:TraR/DksA C4-type zinc finger protein, partial [Vibrio sp. 10N.261.45.A7]
ESAKECYECGDEIPEARRVAIAGCRYCASCQAERE